MLRLNLAAGPRWIDLGHDVRIEVLPMNTELRIRASGKLLDQPEGEDAVKRDVAYTKGIASLAIIAWEGIAGEDDKPAPVTPENIGALLDIPDLYIAFQREYVMPGMLVQQEGNGFAPSPNGSSEGAAATVEPAPPPAKTAPSA